MADGETTEPIEQDAPDSNTPNPDSGDIEIDFELRDTLPGGRAVLVVEQEGKVIWLAGREYVRPEAIRDFKAEMQRMVREGWRQNWPGAC